MSLIEISVCDTCEKESRNLCKDKWITIEGKVWVRGDAICVINSTGIDPTHFCGWKCFEGYRKP